ncbi:hypothetical protein VFPPC_00116 [Pochonia chlamydosporia 170]|uniref:Uncharacterized protein n=1 Tax=Pochonia chlamydosporia 170 TaxID=1380566 RepID=A0A179G2G6_METCM|nr:hypothetical protein VFPPC_00116 [Pochonia chlamydosporia 170]OAQ72055.1 hypothetical protein VFPPC_00116 [Pochonia chlamydosporia 170]
MDENAVPAQKVPAVGRILCMIISLVATTVLTLFLTKRTMFIKSWSRLPVTVWLVFLIYVDSYMFVIATAVLQQSVGVNASIVTCEGAILLCLVCYVTTKFIYLFLVEKAHFIRGTSKKRLRSKLYIFNAFGMVGLYVVVGILNFLFRIAKIENGQCVIGMKSVAMIPLISFDTVVNIYLTTLFLIPLRNLYSYKNLPRTAAALRLRNVATRTLVGAVATLISSIVNLSVLMALKGEAGWVCLLCCNCDILFSAIVIQWVTSKDNAGTAGDSTSRDNRNNPKATFTQEMTPGGLQSANRNDSMAPITQCSTKSDGNTDDTADCGGILVTTTIKSEVKADAVTKASGPTQQVREIRGREMYAAEEGRVGYRNSGQDGYASPDGISCPRTLITAGSYHGRPASPRR